MSEEKLLKEAVKLCLDNAEQYHKDAEILVALRSYGHALALTVLGEEELSKAIIYYLRSEGLLPENFRLHLDKKQYGYLDEQAWAKGLTISYKIVELGESIRKSIEKSVRIMVNINTDALEYAPAISADGLELFFTRLDLATRETGIYRAVRDNKNAAFKQPEVIDAIDGFVEGPAFSPDERSIYYHRLNTKTKKFELYRVTRQG